MCYEKRNDLRFEGTHCINVHVDFDSNHASVGVKNHSSSSLDLARVEEK
jgi:hypothetical protein